MSGKSSVGRVLTAILALQIGIGGLLVFGDIQRGSLGMPDLWTDAPRLSEPVRPGDQRRVFAPNRDRPAVRPARDPGDLPDRLVLTPATGGTWRLEGGIAEGDGARIVTQLEQAEDAGGRVLLLRLPLPVGGWHHA